MLNLSSVLTFALIGVAASAPAQVADVTDADRLKESSAKWQKARDESGGDYSYLVTKSFFTGARQTTTITVRGNKVVERKFELLGPPQPLKPGEDPPAPKPKWVETGKDVGSHKDEGAAPRSVDELYADALKLLEMKLPEHHKRYLGFDKQGLLSHCFIVDTRIADDAPITGIAPIQIHVKPKK